MMKLFRVFSEAPSTAEKVENSPLFSAFILKNKPKTGKERLCFKLIFNSPNSFDVGKLFHVRWWLELRFSKDIFIKQSLSETIGLLCYPVCRKKTIQIHILLYLCKKLCGGNNYV